MENLVNSLIQNVYIFRRNLETLKLGAVHILCQPKMGRPDSPSPLVSQKSEIGLPSLPPLSEKIRNWLTPPPPHVRNHILSHSK